MPDTARCGRCGCVASVEILREIRLGYGTRVFYCVDVTDCSYRVSKVVPHDKKVRPR